MSPTEETWGIQIVDGDAGVADSHGTVICKGLTLRQAHLIAATPDLYRALEALDRWERAACSAPAALRAQARDALEKARGET